MKTHDEQELDYILEYKKIEIAKMLVTVQRASIEAEKDLRNQIAALKAEIAGRDKVFKLLEMMAGESNLGLKVSR